MATPYGSGPCRLIRQRSTAQTRPAVDDGRRKVGSAIRGVLATTRRKTRCANARTPPARTVASTNSHVAPTGRPSTTAVASFTSPPPMILRSCRNTSPANITIATMSDPARPGKPDIARAARPSTATPAETRLGMIRRARSLQAPQTSSATEAVTSPQRTQSHTARPPPGVRPAIVPNRANAPDGSPYGRSNVSCVHIHPPPQRLTLIPCRPPHHSPGPETTSSPHAQLRAHTSAIAMDGSREDIFTDIAEAPVYASSPFQPTVRPGTG
jgi:hypothetical protein